MAIETLGSSGSGGWAFDAATGPQSAPVINVWGIPVCRDVNLPSGAVAGNWAHCDMFIGSEFRIDVSSEAGTRFDQNVTGVRGEESSASTPTRTSAPAVRQRPRPLAEMVREPPCSASLTTGPRFTGRRRRVFSSTPIPDVPPGRSPRHPRTESQNLGSIHP
jgi:hypothetical protein